MAVTDRRPVDTIHWPSFTRVPDPSKSDIQEDCVTDGLSQHPSASAIPIAGANIDSADETDV